MPRLMTSTSAVSALVVTPDVANSPPRVLLEVTLATDATISILRQDPDGRWRPVRGAEPAALAGGTWTGWDYEAPYGVDVTYQLVAASGTQTFGPYRLEVSLPWLIHPGVPSRSVAIRVQSLSEITTPIRQGVFAVLGRSTPVVVSQQRDADMYNLVLRTDGPNDHGLLREVLADGSTLLLNIPDSLGWDFTDGWISVGEVKTRRLAGYGTDPVRYLDLPVRLVDRPAGGQQSQWTCDTLLSEQSSCDTLLASYASCSTLAAHRRAA